MVVMMPAPAVGRPAGLDFFIIDKSANLVVNDTLLIYTLCTRDGLNMWVERTSDGSRQLVSC